MLSEITSGNGAALKMGGDLIDQVARRKAQDGGLVAGSMDQQEKHTGSQQQSSSEVDTCYFSGFRCILENLVELSPVDF